MILHGYFRSAASWRVRMALGFKGVAVEQRSHHLRRGEQKLDGFLALNRQGLVPVLQLDDGTTLTQSLAIIEWLEETVPEPSLLPRAGTAEAALARARIRAFANVLAADTHPIQNLGVLDRLRKAGVAEPDVIAWARETNRAGLAACASLLPNDPAGPFCFGAEPSLADLCLVPQLANAQTVRRRSAGHDAPAACRGRVRGGGGVCRHRAGPAAGYGVSPVSC